MTAAAPGRVGGRAPTAFYVAVLGNFVALGMYLTVLQRLITEDLGASKSWVGLAVGVFFAAALFVRPPVGRALDRLGRRPFLVGSLATLVVLTVGFELAGSPLAVVVLRVLQGFAGASFYVAAAAVATDLASDERRATAVAWFSLAIYGGFAIGPGLGELVVRQGSVSWAFAVAAGCWVVALVAALRLPETGRARPAAGAHARQPLVHRAAVGPGLVLASATVGYVAVSGFSALYADRLELSGGLMYATFAGSVFAVRLVAGNLADRVGRMAVALPGLVAAAAGLALLAAATPGPAGLAYLGTAGFGVGHGLLFPALMAWVVDLAPPAERGGALGSFTAFGDLGQGGGGWAVGRIVDTAGFPAAYLTTAALCVMGMGVLAVLRLRPPAAARPG